jgi:hypothetical protein
MVCSRSGALEETPVGSALPLDQASDVDHSHGPGQIVHDGALRASLHAAGGIQSRCSEGGNGIRRREPSLSDQPDCVRAH